MASTDVPAGWAGGPTAAPAEFDVALRLFRFPLTGSDEVLARFPDCFEALRLDFWLEAISTVFSSNPKALHQGSQTRNHELQVLS